jgi:hypothetical protein
MTVPFRATDASPPRLAAFLRVIRDEPVGYDGALFVMNDLGEPLEIVVARLETPRTVLWRARELQRRAARELVAALFGTVASHPLVVLSRADEIPPGFFATDVEAGVFACRVTTQLTSVPADACEHAEEMESEGLHLLWTPECPKDDSPERLLMTKLRSAGLLTEPFERAEAGLRVAKEEDAIGHGAVR